MTRHVRNIWKTVLYFLISGSTAIFIAACYGIAYTFLGTWKIAVKNKEGKPVKGLSIEVMQYGSADSTHPSRIGYELTDSTGTVDIPLESPYKDTWYKHTAIIKDIDSTANGGYYRDTTIIKSDAEESEVIIELRK